ncbi:MAG: YggS family pyridoxal phosphate-dependent enzyme [bacterium]
MVNIADNYAQVMRRITLSRHSSKNFDRQLTLLAVSKGQPVQALRVAYDSGARHFGENYLQEALSKIESLTDLPDIRWHFVGPIQSNKTRAIAENFHWVHTVDRLKIASRLNDQRPDTLPPLNVCLQVNIDKEPQKAGVAPEDAEELALEVVKLPRLKLRGLMCIPRNNTDGNPAAPFRAMRLMRDQLRDSHSQLALLDTLSMGMSADLEVAIAEGATIVRVGTDIFGPRVITNPSSG